MDGRAGACDTYEPKWQPPSLWHLALLWRLLSLLLLVPLLLWLALGGGAALPVTRVLLSPVSMVVFVFLLVFVLSLLLYCLCCHPLALPLACLVALDHVFAFYGADGRGTDGRLWSRFLAAGADGRGTVRVR